MFIFVQEESSNRQVMNHYLNTHDDWYRMPVMTAKIGANAEERQVFFDAGMQINYFPLSQRDILAGMHEIQRTSVRFITESGQTHKIEGVMTLFTKMEEEHMIIAESQFQGSVEMKFLIGLMNNLPITIGEKSIRRIPRGIRAPQGVSLTGGSRLVRVLGHVKKGFAMI